MKRTFIVSVPIECVLISFVRFGSARKRRLTCQIWSLINLFFNDAILAKDSICDHPFSFPIPTRPEGDPLGVRFRLLSRGGKGGKRLDCGRSRLCMVDFPGYGCLSTLCLLLGILFA